MKDGFMSIEEALGDGSLSTDQPTVKQLTEEERASALEAIDEMEPYLQGINLSAVFPDVDDERLQSFMKESESGKVGFFEEMADLGLKDVPFIGDVAGAHEMYEQHEAMEALSEGSMTPEQQELVLDAIASQARGGKTFMAEAGELFKGALTFGGEMAGVAVTGGAAAGALVGKKAGVKAIKAGVRRKSQRALSDALGDNLARRAAKTLASTVAVSTRAAALGVGVTAAKEAIPRPFYGIGAANATSVRRLFGELNAAESRDTATLLNENIDALMKEGGPMSWKGLSEVFMINSLEVAGGPLIGGVAGATLGKIPPVAWMNALGVKAIERGLNKLPGKGRTFERIQGFLRDRAAFNGEINEVAEELLQNTITEETFGNDWRDGLPEDFEELAAMFVGFGMLPASGLAAGTAVDGAQAITNRFNAQARARREQRKLPKLPEGLSSDVDETQQGPRDVTPEAYRTFVDTGEVDDATVLAIADSIENGNADVPSEGEFGEGIPRDPRVLELMGDSAVSERVEAELVRRAAQSEAEGEVEVEVSNAARSFGDAILEEEGGPVALRSMPAQVPDEADESKEAQATRARSFSEYVTLGLAKRLGRRVYFVDSDAPRRDGAPRGAFDPQTGTIFIDGQDANPLKTLVHEVFHSGMARVGQAAEGSALEVQGYLQGAFPEQYKAAEALYRGRNPQADQLTPEEFAEEVGATMAEELYEDIVEVMSGQEGEQSYREFLAAVIEEANQSPAAQGFWARMLEVLRDMAAKLRLMPPKGLRRKALAEVMETDPATAEEQARLIMDLVSLLEGTTSGSVDVFEDEAGRLRFAPPSDASAPFRDVLDEEFEATQAYAKLAGRQALSPSELEKDEEEDAAMYLPGGQDGVHRYPRVLFHGSNRPFGDMVSSFIGRGEATQWEGYGFYIASHPEASDFYARSYAKNALQAQPDVQLPELPAVTFGARLLELRDGRTVYSDPALERKTPTASAPWLEDEQSLAAFDRLASVLHDLSPLPDRPNSVSAAKLLNSGLQRLERVREYAQQVAYADEDARDLLSVNWDDFASAYVEEETVDAVLTELRAARTSSRFYTQEHAQGLVSAVQEIVRLAEVDGDSPLLGTADSVTRGDLVFAQIAALFPAEVWMPMALGREDSNGGFYGKVLLNERFSNFQDQAPEAHGELRQEFAQLVSLASAQQDFEALGLNVRSGALDLLEQNRSASEVDGSIDFVDVAAKAVAGITNAAMATKALRSGEVKYEGYPAPSGGVANLYAMDILAPRTSLLQHDLGFEDQVTASMDDAAKRIVFWMAENYPGYDKLENRKYDSSHIRIDKIREAARSAYELQVQLDAGKSQDPSLGKEVESAWDAVLEAAARNGYGDPTLLHVMQTLGNRVDTDPRAAEGKLKQIAKNQRAWSQSVRAELMRMGVRGFEYPGDTTEGEGARNFVIFSSVDVKRRLLAPTAGFGKDGAIKRSAKLRVGVSSALPLFAKLEREATGTGGMRPDAMALLADTADAFIGQTLEGVRHERLSVPVMQVEREGAVQTVLESHIVASDVGVRELIDRAHRIGQGLGQEQVHVLEPVLDVTKYEPRHRFSDDSFVTQSVEFSFPLAEQDVGREVPFAQALVEAFGLDSVIINPAADAEQLRENPQLSQVATTASTYYSGDPRDKEAFEQWQVNTQRAVDDLRSRYPNFGAKEGAYILHSIGTPGSGAQIEYERPSAPLPVTTRPNTAQSKRTLAHRAAEFLLNGIDLQGSRNVQAFGGNAGPRWDAASQKEQQERFDADLFNRMPKDDTANALVSRSYAELNSELVKQWELLPIRVIGKEGDGNVYDSSTDMRRDVQQNNRMDFALSMPGAYGPEGFVAEDNSPLMQPAVGSDGSVITDANGRNLLYNDLLRVVHDYFAHALTDNEFGELGEEGARRTHMAITTNPWAMWALMTETYGNNTWVNFWAPNRKKAAKDRPFADQKVGLMPIQSLLLRSELPPMPTKAEEGTVAFEGTALLDRIVALAEKEAADASRPKRQKVTRQDVDLLTALARPKDQAALQSLMLHKPWVGLIDQWREMQGNVDPIITALGLQGALALKEDNAAEQVALAMFGLSNVQLPAKWSTYFDSRSSNFKTAVAELMVDQPLVDLAADLRSSYLAEQQVGAEVQQDPAKGSFADDGPRPMTRVLPRLKFAPYANGRARYDNGPMSDFDPYVMSSAAVDSKVLARAGRGRLDRRYIPSVSGMSDNAVHGAAKFLRLTALGRRFKGLEDKALIKRVMGVMKKNALFFHDLYPQELRDEARLWYAGGFRLCTETADKNNLSTPSVAAAMAAFSPNKPWMLNLTQGMWAAEIYASDRFTTMTDEELEMAYRYASGGKNVLRPYIERAQGKTLQDLIVNARGKMPSSPEGELVAMFVKFRSITKFEPVIPLYMPSGKPTGDVQRNKPKKPGELGAPTKGAFGMMGEITKSMLIFDAEGRDDHREIIDKAIGEKNKVRSFYMNLLYPNDLAGDVTNDTHNVAALVLMPLSGQDVYVTQGLSGGKGSNQEKVVQEFWAPHGGFDASFGVPNERGIKGLYGIFTDVVREAAMERGILPREMQSIVWEAVRGLYEGPNKTMQARRAVTALWDRWAEGKISQPEVQRQVMGLFKGIDYPEWSQQDLTVVDVNGTIAPRPGSSAERTAAASGSGSLGGAGSASGGAGPVNVQSSTQQTAGARRRRSSGGAADGGLKFAPRTNLKGFGYERQGATAEELREARAAFDERRELQTPTATVPSLPMRAGELRLLANVNDEPVRMEPNDEPSRTAVVIAPDGTAYLSGRVADDVPNEQDVMVPVTWFGGAERGKGDWTASGVADKAFGQRGTVGPKATRRTSPGVGPQRSERQQRARRALGLSLTPEELARGFTREAIRRGEELPPFSDPSSTGLVPSQPVEAAPVTASGEQAPAAAGESTLQDDAQERRPQEAGGSGAVAPDEEVLAEAFSEPADATQAPRRRRGRQRMLDRREERARQARDASLFDDAPTGQPSDAESEVEPEPQPARPVDPPVDAPRDAGFGANVPVAPVRVGNATLNNPGNTAETRALWDIVDRDRAVRGGQVLGREEAEQKARQAVADDYDGTRVGLESKLSRGEMMEPWENRAMVNIINDLFMQTLNPRLSENERREALHDARELGFAYREMRANLARSMGSVVGLGMTAKEQVILLMMQLPVIEARRRARIDQELQGYLRQVSSGPVQSQYLQTFFGARRQQGSEYDLRNAPPVNERGQIVSERRLQQLIERKRADEELDFQRQERARVALEKAGYDAFLVEDPDALLDPVHGHLIRNIISSAKATWTDKAIELRQSNLLTGISTHVVNTTGNSAMLVVNGPVQRLVEGMVADSLRLTMPKKDLDALPSTREIVPFMMGGIRAIPEAVKNFFEAIRTEGPIFEMNLKRAGAQFGAYTQKLDTQDGVKVAGMKGRAARMFSFTMLQAIDEMFKTIAGNMEASALAFRVAFREGLRGNSLQRRMDELMADKTNPVWTEALYFGREITLQDTGGEVAQQSSRLLNSMGEMLDRMTEWMVLPIGSIAQGLGVKGASRDQNIALPVGLLLFPFRRVPLRLTAQAMRRSPMASLGMVKNKVRGNYDGDDRLLVRDIADGFIAFGLFMMLLEVLDDEDDELPVITGSRPISRGEAGAEYRTAPPMSVRIGDSYYNYGRIEPLGTSMAIAIDAIDQYRRTGATDAVATGTASLVGMLEDKTFLRSIGDLITIMREYRGGNVSEGEAAARFLRNLYVTPWVPNLIRQTARESAVEYQLPRSIVEDGYPAFMVDGMLDSKGEPIATGLTGVAPAIKRDLWGRPIRRGQGEDGFGSDLLMRLLTPMRHMREVKDISPIDMALVTANERIRRNELVDVDAYFPTLPTRNFTVTVFEDGEEVKEKRRMTSPQYDEFIRDAGQAAHAGLLRLLAPDVREAYDFSFTPDSDTGNLESLADEVEYVVSKKMDKLDDWSGEFNFEDPGAAELAAIKAAKDAAYRLVRKELADRVTGQ